MSVYSYSLIKTNTGSYTRSYSKSSPSSAVIAGCLWTMSVLCAPHIYNILSAAGGLLFFVAIIRVRLQRSDTWHWLLLNIAHWVLGLSCEIPLEAPLCSLSVQKFSTVHFPRAHRGCSGKMLEHEAVLEPVFSRLWSSDWILHTVKDLLFKQHGSAVERGEHAWSFLLFQMNSLNNKHSGKTLLRAVRAFSFYLQTVATATCRRWFFSRCFVYSTLTSYNVPLISKRKSLAFKVNASEFRPTHAF